jgi:hypothetical protein
MRMFAFLSKANEEYATITDLRSFLETKGESKTVYLRLHRIIKSLEGKLPSKFITNISYFKLEKDWGILKSLKEALFFF